MNAETIAKLIVMVCELIKSRSGGTGLEARVADRVLAELAGALPQGSRSNGSLPDRCHPSHCLIVWRRIGWVPRTHLHLCRLRAGANPNRYQALPYDFES